MITALAGYLRRHHWGIVAAVLALSGSAYAVESRTSERAAGGCPNKTVKTIGICMEKKPRVSSKHLVTDMETCSDAGRRMVSFAELHSARRASDIKSIPPPSHPGGTIEWTADIDLAGTTSAWGITYNGEVTTEDAGASGATETWFRCAVG